LNGLSGTGCDRRIKGIKVSSMIFNNLIVIKNNLGLTIQVNGRSINQCITTSGKCSENREI